MVESGKNDFNTLFFPKSRVATNDIAIFGNIDFDLILKIRVKLECQNLPYKIDLIDYSSISEPALKHEIDSNGILLYEKASEL